MIKVNDVKIDSDSEDDTLKDDEVNEVNSATTDVSHTTELLVDDANVVISSPLPTPCPDDDKSKINGLKKLVNIFLYLLLYTYHICWTDLKKKMHSRFQQAALSQLSHITISFRKIYTAAHFH